nr:type IV secretion system DNA-binding domain-containing protein [Pigmentiphaga litoralis]
MFVDELSHYLIGKCTDVLDADTGHSNKVTLVVQSLPLAETLAVFKRVDDFFLTQFPGTEKTLKISKGLWQSWSAAEKAALVQANIIQENWVDMDDQLTTFRNKGHCVFFGFDHASDKGSLKDFHLVGEDLLWRRVLEQRYRIWVERIAEHLCDQNTSAIDALVGFLDTVEKFNAGRLLRVANFFQDILARRPDNLRDVVAECYASLASWGALPLLNVPIGRNSAKVHGFIDLGHRFAMHTMFASKAERDKTLGKLAAAETGDDAIPPFALPDPVIEGQLPYDTAAEYLADVRTFVLDNNKDALTRLRQSDARPLLTLLQKRVKKEGKAEPKTATLKGYSDVVFLQAIKLTIQRWFDSYGNQAEHLDNIKIRINLYEADVHDPERDLNRLLNGIVGAVIPERLNLPEAQQEIPVTLEGLDEPVVRNAKAMAKISFTVEINSSMDVDPFEQQYVWPIPTSHPERIRLVLAELALRSLSALPAPRLPAFRIGGFDELFSAIDEQDAHRLLMLGINEFRVANVFDDVARHPHFAGLISSCTALTSRYKEHLEAILDDGFYAANSKIHLVITAYSQVVRQVIERQAGAEYVLPCLYRAFLAVRSTDTPTQPFLSAAVALPVSPFVLELSSARAVFLRDGFSEVVAELFSNGNATTSEHRWQRLVELAELRRPIAALVADPNLSLTTASQAFGLTHLIGIADRGALPVASQSLMRQETFDDDDLSQKLQPSGRARIYEDLIRAYQSLHSHSHDQLSLLFTNIAEINIVLSGVDKWLNRYLTETVEQPTPFHLTLKVITTGVATTTAVNMLVAWKNAWTEGGFSKQRQCSIHIGHRHATKPAELEEILLVEQDLRFDLGVIAHFLDDKHDGDQLEPVEPFDAVASSVLRQFPLAEYPRPVRQLSAQSQRQMSISNRRVQMASAHTEIAARLKISFTATSTEHEVVTQIDFTPWKKTVELLHRKAVWVSCVDRHVDNNLLAAATIGSINQDRRIVGFSCGLGNYGELNKTISTEVSDFATLTKAIAKRLRQHLQALSIEQANLAAHNVINAACEIPGLSLVRAIGRDEYIRDVVGYSLISRQLGRDPTTILQALLPLDSFRHWFRDREDPNIPDLLFLSAKVLDGRLSIDATVIESKFAYESVGHAETAFAQASSGIRQLVRIFAPQGAPIRTIVFERKYWWAQLHRALSSRAVVMLAQDEYRALCGALDRLSEGDFTIAWRAVASTFWTSKATVPTLEAQSFMGPVDVSMDLPLPNGFGVYQLQYGTEDVIRLLTEQTPAPFAIPGTPLVLSSAERPAKKVPTAQLSAMEIGPIPAIGAEPSIVAQPTAAEIPDLRATLSTEQQSSSFRKVHSARPMDMPVCTVAVETPLIQASTTQQPFVAPPLPDHASSYASVSGATPVTSICRLLIGTDSRGQNVHWEYGDAELENRHLLIFGGSGSGKTYAIQCLLLEMIKQRQHAAIIDYTDGFLPSKLDQTFVDRAQPQTHVLVQKPFPINPFQRLEREEPGIGHLQEQSHNVASRVADVFASVYTIGEVQRAALARHIEQGLSANIQFGLEDLLGALESDSSAPATLSVKIAEFVKQRPFSLDEGSGWKQIFRGELPAHILQLVNISKDMQRLITEFALWDFFAYASRNGSKDSPLPVVLDEVQNLDHRSDRAIDKLLREGRKFGVSMILATQTISQFDKEQRSRLFQCTEKLFFKPVDTELKEFAQILAELSTSRSRDEWITELSKLAKGECWAIGPHRIIDGKPMRREPVKVKITSLNAR